MLDFSFKLAEIQNEYETIVIGAGPGGLTCALYLCRALVKTLLVEKSVLGGKVILTSLIENYPGFESITGIDLIEKMVRQIRRYELPVLYEEVVRLILERERIFIVTSAQRVACRTLVICTGSSYRRLEVPGEKELTGKGVSYCATCDGLFFKDRVVAMVGGGDSALKEALYLAKIARKVYLIHRRREFRGERIIQDEIGRVGRIEAVLEKVVVEIKGKDRVEAITIKEVSTGDKSELAVDGVFINIGNIPESKFCTGIIKMDEQGYIIADHELRTSVPSIFAVGDVRVNKQRQIATAVGDGAMVAALVEEYLGRR